GKSIRDCNKVARERECAARYVSPGADRIVKTVNTADLEIVTAAIHHQAVTELVRSDQVQLSGFARIRQAGKARDRNDRQPLFVGCKGAVVVAGDAKIEAQSLLFETVACQGSTEIAMCPVHAVA